MRGAGGEPFRDWHRRLLVMPVRMADGTMATDVWCRVGPAGFEYRATTHEEQVELAWWQARTSGAADDIAWAAAPDPDQGAPG